MLTILWSQEFTKHLERLETAQLGRCLFIMWYAALVRFIRRRLVLGIIFASSLTYCIVSFWREGHKGHIVYQDIPIDRKPFVWRTLQEHNDTNEVTRCRNSIQGKFLIVDDRGYVCQRKDRQRNGCCNVEADFTERYSCDTCLDNNCCLIYEFCVSCCLDPSKRNLLQVVLEKLSKEKQVLFRLLTDDYELCLTKCRTSSASVLHENSYKFPNSKHCFGDEPPYEKPD